jgi:hypothetical protein
LRWLFQLKHEKLTLSAVQTLFFPPLAPAEKNGLRPACAGRAALEFFGSDLSLSHG